MSEAEGNVLPAHRCPHGWPARLEPAEAPKGEGGTWAVAVCPTGTGKDTCKVGGWCSAAFRQ